MPLFVITACLFFLKVIVGFAFDLCGVEHTYIAQGYLFTLQVRGIINILMM